ncbi:glycosyltransferase family 4 protein [Halosimplex sp. TS25]|uniref:glycosyltransferase family 4 protein n=1 Tax=Halosimplex rarum TaxID=3396619 RepID=UPI0039E8FA92
MDQRTDEPADRRTDGPASDGLRVCVFTSAHDATDSRVVGREAVSLAEAGHDVTYYTPFDGDSPVETVTYGDAEEGSMISMGARLRAAADVARVLVDTDYDVYHFHDVECLPVGAFLSVATDGTVVYDVHENVEDTLRHKPIFPEPIRPVAAKAAGLVELGLSRVVDEIVTASPDIAERFADRDPTVVTNYPQRRWAEETDPSADIEPDDEGPTRLVYRGLLSEGRGIHTLIEAVERIPDEYDVELSIGGKYDSEDERAGIERRIEASDRVEFVEWFPSLEGMIHHFRAADIGMMCFHPDPNKTDAVHRSNKLFQYMSAGLPVVVSDIGSWGALVEDVGCGVAVEPGDPDAVAETLVSLVDDPDRRTALGRNGHRAALDRFNWESQREKLLGVYDRHTPAPYRGNPGQDGADSPRVEPTD